MSLSLDKHPNFFIIGSPKCGTTAMSDYLTEHPEVYFSPVKEPNYYNAHFYNYSYSFEEYLKLFINVDLNRHKAIGEGSTLYLYSKQCISSIIKHNPASKFIVMLIDPVSAAVSIYNQSFKSIDDKRREKFRTFDQMWKKLEYRKKRLFLPKNF